MKTLIVKSITKISIASICSIGIVDGLGRISDGIKAIADSNIYAEDFKHMRWSQEFDLRLQQIAEIKEARERAEKQEKEKQDKLARERLDAIKQAENAQWLSR